MKPFTKLIFALTAVAALSFAHPAKANLIINPGFEFEDGFNGWTFVNGADRGFGGGHSGIAYGFMPSNGVNVPAISQAFATTRGAT